MMSRICWSFSAAYRFNKQPQYYATAERAFNYIFDHFVDREHGGVYWSVDAVGKMLDGKKQILLMQIKTGDKSRAFGNFILKGEKSL